MNTGLKKKTKMADDACGNNWRERSRKHWYIASSFVEERSAKD